MSEDTGIEIIQKMKPFIDEYITLLIDYENSAKEAEKKGGVIPKPPQKLMAVKNRIIQLAQKYGELPAYRVYRAYSYLDEDREKR